MKPWRRWLFGAALLLGFLLLLVFESVLGSHRLTVETVEVRLETLPPELDGLRIIQLSDVHYGFGWFRHKDRVISVIERVRSLSPDVVVLTGDLLDMSAPPSLVDALPLEGIKAPLGAYAVLGNHDHAVGQAVVVRALAGKGINVLVNESVRLENGGVPFWLVGVDDPFTGEPDLDKALTNVPMDAFKILLAHAPDFAPRAAEAGLPLVLSGHSHGGQVCLPGVGGLAYPPLGRKYSQGLHRVEGTRTWVYTNRGLGTSIVPVRLFCPPEVTVLTLRATREPAPR
ncbi:metallophosphoesterase [Neomoorella mulderi]|uniref:Putative metallophosphoesterase n=1 Tax=Moorella mulderi DSM 14980 TaxID=1122241 RepID=A0A151B0Z5_9FIRM|nr:metallophosphoesterase [Moorella mulderi]KYH33317.1 putative metallophosphoesterase [Moorella mulderi DSM 14980]